MISNSLIEIDNLCNFDIYYDISNESLSGKNIINQIWIRIKTFFKKAIQIIKNFILNLNMIKKAVIHPQMNKDIQIVCQNLNPRYQMQNNVLRMLTGIISISTSKDKDYLKELSEISEASIEDCDSIINDVTNSQEYKRIKGNLYDKAQEVEVPISNVISSMKKTQMSLINYESAIEKSTSNAKFSNNEIIQKANKIVIPVFTKVCTCFRMKIECLSIFFQRTKASISALKDNVKDRKEKSVDVERSKEK